MSINIIYRCSLGQGGAESAEIMAVSGLVRDWEVTLFNYFIFSSFFVPL